MSNVQITVVFAGIEPAPDWWYIWKIGNGSAVDILFIRAENASDVSLPDGWSIIEPMGKVNVAALADGQST